MSVVLPFCRAIALLALLTMVGCSPGPVGTFTEVAITNLSAASLSNVVVSGSGFSDGVGGIAAWGAKTIRVYPRGDSGLRLTFDPGGQHLDSGQQACFDAKSGYRVSTIIHTDLSVSVSTRLPPGGLRRTQADVPQLSNVTHDLLLPKRTRCGSEPEPAGSRRDKSCVYMVFNTTNGWSCDSAHMISLPPPPPRSP